MKFRYRLLIAVSVVALAVWGVSAGASTAEEYAGATIGSPAPNFLLMDEAGQPHRLSDYRGNIVVMEWTNPDCPFVQRHYKAGTFTGLAKEYADRDIVWLAINSSHFAQAADAKAWRATHKMNYPTLLDPDGQVGRAYRAKTTPHMFIVDSKGTLVYDGAIDDSPRDTSAAETNYVRNAVNALLAGEAVSPAKTRPYGCSVKYKG